MSNFVINQLINAVIVIIVTVVTVRYTMLGSPGVSQRVKVKLTAASHDVILIIVPLLMFALVNVMLYRAVKPEGPIQRFEIIFISFYTYLAAHWLFKLFDAISDQRQSRKKRNQPPVD